MTENASAERARESGGRVRKSEEPERRAHTFAPRLPAGGFGTALPAQSPSGISRPGGIAGMLLDLQRTAGNTAVNHLLRSYAARQTGDRHAGDGYLVTPEAPPDLAGGVADTIEYTVEGVAQRSHPAAISLTATRSPAPSANTQRRVEAQATGAAGGVCANGCVIPATTETCSPSASLAAPTPVTRTPEIADREAPDVRRDGSQTVPALLQRQRHHPSPQSAAGSASPSPLADPTVQDSPLADPTVQEVLAHLRVSPLLIDRNTAEAIDTRRVHLWFIDSAPLVEHGRVYNWAAERTSGVSTRDYEERTDPITHESVSIERHAMAVTTSAAASIGIRRSVSGRTLRDNLVHEVNHALSLRVDVDPGSFAVYENEFRAYWAQATNPDLDARWRIIRDALIGSHAAYPLLQATYQQDAEFRRQVDAYRRPQGGNQLNSVRLATVQEALATGGRFDEEAVLTAIAAMGSEERAALQTDASQMEQLRTRSSDNGVEVTLLVEGYSRPSVLCARALRQGRDVARTVVVQAQFMTPAERGRLIQNSWFMAHLRDVLSGAELQRAEAALGGLAPPPSARDIDAGLPSSTDIDAGLP